MIINKHLLAPVFCVNITVLKVKVQMRLLTDYW